MTVNYEYNYGGIQVIIVTRRKGPLSGKVIEGFMEMFNFSWEKNYIEKNLREKKKVTTSSDTIHIHLI